MDDGVRRLALKLIDPLRAFFVALDTTPIAIRARIYNSGNQSIPNNAVSGVTFNANRYDTDGMSSASGFTCTRAGSHTIGITLRWAANNTGMRVVYILVNGAFVKIISQNTISGSPTDMGGSTEYDLAVGDTVTFQVLQNSGAALNILTGSAYSPEAWIRRNP